MKPTPRALVVIALFALAAPAFAQDVLVVAPKDFEPALADWKAFREKQGLAVAVRAPTSDISALVKETFDKSGKKLRFVMLVGDADRVPCVKVQRKGNSITAMFGAEPEIATDDPYADLDGDGVPELSIGRVSADSVDEAKAYLARAIAYETNPDFGTWRRKLDLVAGTGGFGPMVDMALEGLTKQLLAKSVPPDVDVSMTYASPLSPFCPWPAEFADVAVHRWNEGALIVAYVGHGSRRAVDRVTYGKDEYPIFGPQQVAKVAAEHGPPISLFIACSTGHFDEDPDCLAEEMLKRPGGPVAVIASSRVSSPYTNGIVAKEVLDALFVTREATVGELLRAVKHKLLDTPKGDAMRDQLERMAVMFEKDPEKRKLDRADHLYLYNLLGDPCLRIARPGPLDIEVPAEIAPGAKLHVAGTAPFAATAIVELARRRDVAVKSPPGGKKTPEDFRAVYELANSPGIARLEVPVKAGPFAVDLTVPADAAGNCTVRVYLVGAGAAASGGRDLAISAPTTK